MDKYKIKMLKYLNVTISSIFSFFLFLALVGVLGSNVLGLNIGDFVLIITDIYIFLVVVYTYFYIKVNKRVYGKIIFIMKRTNYKIKMKIWLNVLLICLLIFQLFLDLIVFGNNFNLKTTYRMFFQVMLILIVSFHNSQKEGLADKCVYSWGVPIEWSKIAFYSITEDKLILSLSSETLKKNKSGKIDFKIENKDKESIEYFLLNKSIRKCCE